MKKEFVPCNFKLETLELIVKCNDILESYAEQGYDMTLRQLYYQLVSADEIPNTQRDYNRLGRIVNDARLAGLIDWNHVVDRTRNLKALAHWDSPSEILDSVAYQYRVDKWSDQRYRPEVWIEKDALAGIFERVCSAMDVPLFACRGYTSQSEMYSAARRFLRHKDVAQTPYILHFGDHDPSGLDMTRDIADRLTTFGIRTEVNRLALNMDQIDKYKPPPNPAKVTDSRAKVYMDRFGTKSWELDALRPEVLAALVRGQIEKLIDQTAWSETLEREAKQKGVLAQLSDRYDEVEDFLNND